MAKIEQSIEVNVPVRTAYNQMTQFENYPQFMDGVKEVQQIDDAHLRWRGEKAGKEIEWEAEITEQAPDKVIAWRNTSGPKNIGRVSFQATGDDKARITVSADSDEAATGEAGKATKQRLERDLQRFKEFIEARGSDAGGWRGVIHEGHVEQPAKQAGGRENSANGANGSSASLRSHPARRSTDRATKQQAGQSNYQVEGKMAEQSGSMQFSGEVNPSRASSSQQSQPAALIQAWAQPGRLLSQMSSAFGQMPVRMLEQEASMLQKSFVSPQAWLPNMLNAWEEPFVMMRKMSEEMDQFFGKLLQRPISKMTQNRSATGIVARNWTPTVEISQRGNEMVICADLPGLTKSDVRLQLHEDKLTIEGDRREEIGSQNAEGYHRTERSYGHFYRAIPLPEGIDARSAQAKMRDGVLEISVPLQNQQRQGVRLEIREAEEGELREQRDQQEIRRQREQYEQRQQQQQLAAQQQREQPPQQEERPRQASAGVRIEAQG